MLYNFLRTQITNVHNKLECLSLASHSNIFQQSWASLGAYPREEHLKGSHQGRLRTYSQTLTRLERLAREKHSSLSRTFVNQSRKKFYNIHSECFTPISRQGLCHRHSSTDSFYVQTKNSKNCLLASGNSTAVKHLPRHPKVEGSSPAIFLCLRYNTSFSFQLMNEWSKLECLPMEKISGLVQSNTLAYSVQLYVTRKMKCYL